MIDSPDTPGGCWANFAAIWSDIRPEHGPGEAVVSGFKELFEDEIVEFGWKDLKGGTQYGYDFLADWVHPRREPPTFQVTSADSF